MYSQNKQYMKYFLFLILFSFQASAWVCDTLPDPPDRDSVIIDTTNTHFLDYQLDIAGRAKFRDSVRFEYLTKFFDIAHFVNAHIETLTLRKRDGVLHISEREVYSGPVYLSEVESAPGVFYADTLGKAKVTQGFYFDEETQTIHVPNIVVGDSVSGAFAKLKSIKDDYNLEGRVETLLIDTSQKDISINLTERQPYGKIVLLKKVRGRHKANVVAKDLSLKIKDSIKLIWDGSNWQQL